MRRRTALRSLLTGVAGISIQSANGLPTAFESPLLKGNIRHSVCSWTFDDLTLDELCLAVKKIGFKAIDLVAPSGFKTLNDHGIECSMCYTAGKISLTEGWNRPENHPWLIKDFLDAIPVIAKAGYKNLICFTGNRNGMDDETGLKNCVAGLKQILSVAEKNGVVIQLELFNSKVDHKDYMADRSAWGIELCKRLGSSHFKLLYDIYHMQISEGDVIRTIQDNHPYFGHYHTAGVPGRHEIDETQELYYPAIMQAIFKTGYTGYVAQEFLSVAKDRAGKINSLKNAIRICDI
jgi:hydroxypyruvate isomerase